MGVMEGSLSKWTNVMKGWQYRWFVLDENSGLLSYYTIRDESLNTEMNSIKGACAKINVKMSNLNYWREYRDWREIEELNVFKSKEKMMRGVRRGCVRLKGAVIGIDDEDDSTFTITVDHKTFHFQARDAQERQKWVQALEDAIIRHGNRGRFDPMYQPLPSIKDLDHRVSEADAYLQLMIEQTKKLEERIESITDEEDKRSCQLILEHANAMLDNIKHSIVLLQIAKNTAHPVNGVYQHLAGSSNSETNLGAEVVPGDIIQQGIEIGSECLVNGRRVIRPFVSPLPTSLVVPETSYSSSEGEDDFFDANDDVVSTNSLRSIEIDSPNEATPSAKPIPPVTVSRPPSFRQGSVRSSKSGLSRLSSGELDFDALYEDDDEADVEMESHGSVIRHLLSQVKIGMDLTKVILPTFILERRSLLEMYADFFAHPDLFIKIADLTDARSRMVQVVRWYLSSYHAGRKSALAKKPYNPIIGEVFRCHWDVPNEQSNSSDEPPLSDGPIPWCRRNQTTFVAEQVSHHPPISAFYAEHFDKRISFNAHVYTKSKFLGLSVCVYNIGHGIVSVLDYDEEYIITFPNVYGRSILTTPWVELGGSTSITCPQTGYHCNIEFITKPFYGNKKNRISAEVFEPEDKKCFLSISGEWNGCMDAKWYDKEPEPFIDVRKLDIIKKQVRPISQQEDNESRRLWKEVTAGLKFNEIDKATNAKQALELKQRDEAKDRKELGTEWQTKLFRKGPDDTWQFMKPLRQRLPSNPTTNPT